MRQQSYSRSVSGWWCPLLLCCVVGVSIGGFLACSANGGFQEPKQAARENAKPDAPKSHAVKDSGILNVSRLNDSAFDRYVDVAALGRAVHDLDAAALADAGLHLAEGERILLRTHRSGITARGVLTKAAWLAVRQKDEVTLQRVQRGADKIDDKELLARLDKIQASKEAPAADVTVSLDMTVEAFVLLKGHWNEVTRAELLAHPERLKAAAKRLEQAGELASSHKEALRGRMAKVQKELPKEQSAEDRVLSKLAGTSRGPSIQPTPFNPNPLPNQLNPPTDPNVFFPPDNSATVDFSIVNNTPNTVFFTIGSYSDALLSGSSNNFTTTMSNPAVSIQQPDGTYHGFTVSDGGAYQFVINPRTGFIDNAYLQNRF